MSLHFSFARPYLQVVILLFVLRQSPRVISDSLSSSHSLRWPPLREWRSARATFYSAADPRDSSGGACGYGELSELGYGLATTGLSEALFERGKVCGACFEIKCTGETFWCIPGTSITVTATNFCAPNWGLAADEGGYCNPPNKHFVLPIEAFEKIAMWKADNMPVLYRRVRRGGRGEGQRFRNRLAYNEPELGPKLACRC